MGKLGKYQRIIVPREKLVEQVKRVCSSNLRRPCKICIKCPFKNLALQIMEQYDLKMPDEAAIEKLKKQ